MCVSLCLANIGANWSFWNWLLPNAFLALLSGLYVLYSHFPLFQPGIPQLGKQFVWAAAWLSRAHSAHGAAGWQLASHLKDTCSARNQKRLLLLYWKRRLVADRCLHGALFLSFQELRNGLPPVQWVGETLPWATAAHRQLGSHCFGRREGMGKPWKRWHRAQSLWNKVIPAPSLWGYVHYGLTCQFSFLLSQKQQMFMDGKESSFDLMYSETEVRVSSNNAGTFKVN